MPAVAHKSVVGVGLEATWGVAVSPTEYCEAVSCGLKTDREVIIQAGVNGGRTKKKAVMGFASSGGPLKWEVNPEDTIGWILRSLLPAEDLEDHGSGNGALHKFTPGNTLIPGLSITRMLDHNVRTFFGCQTKSLKLEQSADGLLMADAGMVAKDDQAADAPVASYTDERAFVFHNCQSLLNDVDVPLNLANIDFDAGLLDKRPRLHEWTTQRQLPGKYSIKGNIAAPFDADGEMSQALLDDFYNGVPADLKLIWTTTQIGGGEYRYLKIHLPMIQYLGEQPTLESPEGEVMIKPNFEALDPGDSYLVQVSLNNSRRTKYEA